MSRLILLTDHFPFLLSMSLLALLFFRTKLVRGLQRDNYDRSFPEYRASVTARHSQNPTKEGIASLVIHVRLFAARPSFQGRGQNTLPNSIRQVIY